jgi:lipopolysaccharide transport system ATP-binding protein
LPQSAIVVENLSKKFHIGTGGGPGYHRLSEMLTGLPRFAYNKLRPARPTLPLRESSLSEERAPSLPPPASSRPPASDFWALRDVSFEVQQGEVVGIIGRNGAGKSTLLKILSRITEPTSGRFGVRGRVASLLEVGTGFHPELTGRENIYVSGITLGMTRAEIKKRFDEIVDFSGVEKFLDTPVKHYSSGMQVRLGFAVAAHLESEILIVDEVLAVGDAEFQKKCLGKMGTIAESGRSLLFVTHSMPAVRSLCSRAICIQSGKLSFDGATDAGVNEYLSSQFPMKMEWRRAVSSTDFDRAVSIELISLRPKGSENESIMLIESPLELVIEYVNKAEEALLNASILISTDDCSVVFASTSTPTLAPAGRIRLVTQFPAFLLNEVNYELTVLIVRDEADVVACVDRAIAFAPKESTRDTSWNGKWPGVIRPRLSWTTRIVG